jgi:2-amino-4-hydroxy-6-hydroxymethyldihydropteridine diphosphokinase
MAMAGEAYLGLGSNLGDRRQYICDALTELTRLPDTKVQAVSSLYETAPWGGVEQSSFLNCVALLHTKLSPEHLLQEMLGIESQAGRVRLQHWGPRVIDLDLLLFDDVTVSTEFLKLPHPFLTQRRFVLVPLAELNAHVVVHSKTVAEYLSLLTEKQDSNDVVLWGAPPHFSQGVFR